MLKSIIFSLFVTAIRANYEPEDVQQEMGGVWQKSEACGFTEVFYRCKPCDLLCGQDLKLCPVKECQEGCGCPPNFRRSAEGDCVEYFNCFSNVRPKPVKKPPLFDATTEVPYSRLQYQRGLQSQPKITIGHKLNRTPLPLSINDDDGVSPVIRTENLSNSQAHHHKSRLSNGFPTRHSKFILIHV
ncbi:unnamed protein product [Auanema sp. JU1783]|nr:unnamed protein product [Auanema sp. JU1783]